MELIEPILILFFVCGLGVVIGLVISLVANAIEDDTNEKSQKR